MVRWVLSAAVASLCLAGQAQASTASLTSAGFGPDRFGMRSDQLITYTAAPGETNRVTISNEPEAIVLADAGAVVTAGAGCTSVDAHTVRCAAPSSPFYGSQKSVGEVQLLDGDDTLDVVADPRFMDPGRPGMVHGGDGADVLTGAPRADGDGGNDVIRGDGEQRGGPGDDTLTGGSRMVPGPGADTVTGGEGTNIVDLSDATRPMRASLPATAPIDPAQEGDRISLIEGLVGGRAADVLTATAPAILDGGGGDDTLSGSPGRDTLRGGPGRDRLIGGLGADRLEAGRDDRASGGSGDDALVLDRPGRIACGRGADTVSITSDSRAVPADCERLQVFDGMDPIPARLRPAPRYSVPLSFCVPNSCTTRTTLQIRVGGERTVTAVANTPKDERLTVRLGPRVRRALRRARTATLRFHARTVRGTERATIRLELPR